MEFFTKIISLSFVTILIDNVIFSRAMGTSTMLLVAKNKKHLLGFGLSITYITTMTSALAYPADKLFLHYELNHLYMPMVYVGVVGVVYIITLLFLWKFAYNMFLEVSKFVHISAFNCVVLGTLFLNSTRGDSFTSYVILGFGTGLGFVIATYMLSIVYEQLHSEGVPRSFRGYPIMLIYIGILSMAMYSIAGKGV